MSKPPGKPLGAPQGKPTGKPPSTPAAAAQVAVKSLANDASIESRIIAELGGLKKPEPAIFQEFIEQIVPKIQIPQTTRGILHAFSSPDVTSEKVAEVIRGNPYYEFQFLRMVGSMVAGRMEVPKLEGGIVMMGMQNSRNLVLAIQLLRSVRGSHPTWDKDGKLQIAPQEVLRYALKAEELLGGNKEAYPEIAFAAGMLFDMLAVIAADSGKDKRLGSYIETVYIHSLRAARIGFELSSKVPDFAFKKYVYAACLIHDIGKVVMAILDPGYLDFVEEASKREMPRQVRFFAEEEVFGGHHALYGAICCYYYRVFRPIEKAILHHHYPYLLKDSNWNLYQLSSLVALASNMASNFKKVEKTDDPIVKHWKTAELKDFRMEVRDMIAATSKVN